MQRHRKIALDTNVCIYYLEDHPRYRQFAYEVFAWVRSSGHQAVTSTITMAELLVKPYRNSDPGHALAIYGQFATHPNLQWIAPDLFVAEIAAGIRARNRLKIPDAIQAATADHAKATGFISNDPVFRRVPAFETLLFDELL